MSSKWLGEPSSLLSELSSSDDGDGVDRMFSVSISFRLGSDFSTGDPSCSTSSSYRFS